MTCCCHCDCSCHDEDAWIYEPEPRVLRQWWLKGEQYVEDRKANVIAPFLAEKVEHMDADEMRYMAEGCDEQLMELCGQLDPGRSWLVVSG